MEAASCRGDSWKINFQNFQGSILILIILAALFALILSFQLLGELHQMKCESWVGEPWGSLFSVLLLHMKLCNLF